jgi:hypothetical protein
MWNAINSNPFVMKKYDLHVAINEREKMVKEGYTHHIAWNGRVRAINLKKLTIMKTRRIENTLLSLL